MRKKYLKFFVVLIPFLVMFPLIFTNKEINNKEISKVERFLSKPEGIQAYTLNGQKTNITFNELINGYTINKITCKNGSSATYNKITNEVSLSNIHIPDYCTMDFKHSIYSKLLADNRTIKTRTSFNTTFTETNTGTLYKATESIANSPAKDVYYFAGNATNNWVKFGSVSSDIVRGYGTSQFEGMYEDYNTMEECISGTFMPASKTYDLNQNCTYLQHSGDSIYWRIIRTNHDGSIRLLYAGTSPDTTSGYIGRSAFNSTRNNPMYVGYMYGTSGSLASNRTNTNDSTIKGVIDTWYKDNLKTNYEKYISTEAVYCNDRKAPSYSTSSSFDYYVRTRLNAGNPTYDCEGSKDAFSGSNSEAKLTYPIGLMTADEIAYAGGKDGTSLTSPYAWYYLNSAGGSITGSTYWWLLSPYRWYGVNVFSWRVGGSDNPAFINGHFVSIEGGVRPAISLKGNLVWKSGNGSSASPYEVEDLPPTLTETIKTHATSHTNGVYNENGYRYEGTDPSNYIYMTNKSTNEKELWRIIGVFNDGENGEEVIRVRKHYEKNSYPTMKYDSNKTNHFPNTTMYNTLSSTYNLTNYSHTVNFKMYLGTSASYTSLTSSGWYTAERGTTPGKTAANSYNSSTSFIGSVGLIYLSDYGYAVLASDCPRTKELFSYDGTAACYNNNWLFQGNSSDQWLISPSASDANRAFRVTGRGYVNDTGFVTSALASSSVMALEAGVMVEGTGTKSDPYVITN